MSEHYEHKLDGLRGKGLKAEMDKFYEQATLQRLQDARATEEAIADLRAVNAERRLQDQRDLDADYRNYIVPV
jgi:Skp family chaperone for outer membrane proteins